MFFRHMLVKKSLLVFLLAGVPLVGCHKIESDSQDAGESDSGSNSDEMTDWKPGDPKYDGVDLLIVTKNSFGMDADEILLSTSMFTLINSLTNPLSSWPYEAVSDIRVAVITNDLGLQYGEESNDDGFPYDLEIQGCTDQDSRGDDGRFMGYKKNTISPESGKISCEDEGGQCPADWNCNNNGKCIAPDATTTNCLSMSGNSTWAETTEEQKNNKLATQVACLTPQIKGCGIEQQLEAPVRALSRENQRDFLKDTHLLAVMIISDETDCSIADKQLFETPEFKSGAGSEGLRHTACNLPQENEEDFLFDTIRYRKKFVELKGGDSKSVVFAAFVGVPQGVQPDCEGRGNTLDGCLLRDEMQLELLVYEDTSGRQFTHFGAACKRLDDHDVEVASARPGRRYVKVAQDFGHAGYISSICSDDWNPSMEKIGSMIAQRIESK